MENIRFGTGPVLAPGTVATSGRVASASFPSLNCCSSSCPTATTSLTTNRINSVQFKRTGTSSSVWSSLSRHSRQSFSSSGLRVSFVRADSTGSSSSSNSSISSINSSDASSRSTSSSYQKKTKDGKEPRKVIPPPPDYDFRSAASATRRIVAENYPELLDLVDEGTLLAIPRAEDYEERRSDGYREPEVVFLVGTAHISRKSAEDVDRVVRMVQPQNVVVELCRGRAGAMYEAPEPPPSSSSSSQSFSSWRLRSRGGPLLDSPGSSLLKTPGAAPNLLAIGGESMGAALGRSLQLGGRSAMALRLLLSRLSDRVSKASGVQSGAEFRAARKAAVDVGAQIVLGDRPIEITLQRAWRALSWREKVALLSSLAWAGAMSAKVDVSEEALRKLQTDDALSAMFAELSARFPSLMAPLIHERDVYLAWSLKRSKAVNGCASVVGVVGRGHIRGIVYALTHNQENLRFKDLVGQRAKVEPKEKALKLGGRLAMEVGLGILSWELFKKFF